MSGLIISGVTGINSEVCQGIISWECQGYVSDVVRENSRYRVGISVTALKVIQNEVEFIVFRCEKLTELRLLLN